MLYIILVVMFLLFLGATVSALVSINPADRAPVYYIEAFWALIMLFVFPTFILLTILFIMNWKVTLLIFILCVLFSVKILKPISEVLIVLPLYALLCKKYQVDKEKGIKEDFKNSFRNEEDE